MNLEILPMQKFVTGYEYEMMCNRWIDWRFGQNQDGSFYFVGSLNRKKNVRSNETPTQSLAVNTIIDVKPVSNCFRVVVCLNSSLEKFSWLVQRWVFYSWRSICCLNLIFLLKYEAYPIKWTSDTWCFAGLYRPCGSFQKLRWNTAVWCRWHNLKPVHVIRKILWKTESVMIGKINFLKSKDADLSNLWYFISHWMLWNFGHCCEWGLFCIVFYGSPWHRNDTWMWKFWFLHFNWYSLLGAFILFYWVKKKSM